MKTRKDILEEMHDAGLTSLIDAELVLKIMTRRQIISLPNDDQAKISALMTEQKKKCDQLESNIKVVEEMIAEEEKKDNKSIKV